MDFFRWLPYPISSLNPSLEFSIFIFSQVTFFISKKKEEKIRNQDRVEDMKGNSLSFMLSAIFFVSRRDLFFLVASCDVFFPREPFFRWANINGLKDPW